VDRRDAVIALIALGTAPLAARAQTAGAPWRIAWISPTTIEGDRHGILEAFTSKMKDLGRVEGRDYVLLLHEFGGRMEILPALVREVIGLHPDVIVTGGSASVAALKKETTTIPIVFGTAGDVVEQGFVVSLARPGRNITGVTLRIDAASKVVQFIREALPAARRVAVLEHDGDLVAPRITASYQRAAVTQSLGINVARVTRPEDFERAFADIARAKAEVLLVPQETLFARHSERISNLAFKARLPMVSQDQRRFGESALLCYGSDALENYHRVAVMVDKILKGAKPGDLPVEEPDRFTLTLNARVARAYGILFPQLLLARADRVIE